jgi:hypothetical protein
MADQRNIDSEEPQRTSEDEERLRGIADQEDDDFENEEDFDDEDEAEDEGTA